MVSGHGTKLAEADPSVGGAKVDFCMVPYCGIDVAVVDLSFDAAKADFCGGIEEAKLEHVAGGTRADFWSRYAAGTKAEADPAVLRGRTDLIGSAGMGIAVRGSVASSAADPVVRRGRVDFP